jgi:hypothetical protein
MIILARQTATAHVISNGPSQTKIHATEHKRFSIVLEDRFLLGLKQLGGMVHLISFRGRVATPPRAFCIIAG